MELHLLVYTDKGIATPVLQPSLACTAFSNVQQRKNDVFEANVDLLEDDDIQEGIFSRRLGE